ncbi:WD40-repeat-containing domain protein [Zopfochytrium polystomum]|nr:WD40-repeat-containing domain protein [Zopfochytrium polystomum]
MRSSLPTVASDGSSNATAGEGALRLNRFIYDYQAPWPTYSLHWSQRPSEFRIGVGSFVEDHRNKLEIIQLFDGASVFVKIAEVDHPYPATKFLWSPFKSSPGPDLFAASGDFLRIYELSNTDVNSVTQGVDDMAVSNRIGSLSRRGSLPDSRYKVQCRATLMSHSRSNQGKKDHCAPLTSFDWNETNPSMCVTSSVDTTCTVWDISTQQAKTQLIAHDKEVYDVAFARGTDIFASVGADGSVRMFDLRALEHSTILYETSPVMVPSVGAHNSSKSGNMSMESPPLLRLSWNKQDPNYLATFQMGAASVLILDIRYPAAPVVELVGHGATVNGVVWAPHSASHACSVSSDSNALVWDISQASRSRKVCEPMLTYKAGAEINNVSWSAANTDWVAVAFGNKVQALKV